VKQPSNMEVLCVLRANLDLQIKVLKDNFNTCESASQKNALGTSILTINSLAAAVHGTILSLNKSGEVLP